MNLEHPQSNLSFNVHACKPGDQRITSAKLSFPRPSPIPSLAPYQRRSSSHAMLVKSQVIAVWVAVCAVRSTRGFSVDPAALQLRSTSDNFFSLARLAQVWISLLKAFEIAPDNLGTRPSVLK